MLSYDTGIKKQKINLKKMKLILIVTIFCAGIFVNSAFGQKQDSCSCVRSYINPSVTFPQEECKSERVQVSESRTLEEMTCLLKEKGNTNKSRIWSAVISPKMSDNLSSPTVEIAALYEISRMYYQREDFAWAIMLEHIGKEENNSNEVIRIAYEEYELWLKIVKKIGLGEARKIKFDPLKHSEVRWYKRDSLMGQ